MSGSTHSGTPGPLGRARRELSVFPRQFWLLAGGAFLLLAGIDMCFPFETSYLNFRLHVSMTAIGLILGLPLLGAVPLYIIGGAFTDRYGRKPAIAVGISVAAILYTTFALATHVWQITVAIALEAAFGWALYLTGSNAMVADLVVFERRAEAYSIMRVAQHMGMVLGPIIAGLLLAADPSYRSLFVGGAVICAVYVALMLITFKETKPAVQQREGLRDTLRGYRLVLRDRHFVVFCTLAVLPLFGFGQIWVTLPIALRERQAVSANTWAWLLVFYALTVALLQYPVIRALRRRNLIRVMGAASLFVGAGMFGAVATPWGWPTLLFIFILGQGIVLLIPVAPTVAAGFAPPALRGRYMGLWTLVQESGYALGPIFGGVSMDAFGPVGGAAVAGVCGLTGAVAFWLMAWRVGRPETAAGGMVLGPGEAAQPALAEATPLEPPTI